MGSAEVACVPSLYEGFSLPTAELMACGTPLIVSRAGAIPEVVGPDGYCADLVTPGDVGELEAALAALLDDPERRARDGRQRPQAGRRAVQLAGRRGPGGAGLRGDHRRLRRTSTETRRTPVLTVDFDRLGLRPGDRVLDMGCGAGRHAFEMYRRGADVIAFDMDADELAGVSDLFHAMRQAGEVPEGAEADVKQGDALPAAVRRRRVRPGRRRGGARAHPRRRRGDQGAGPGAAPRRHPRHLGAALAARDHQLEALRRLPQRRGRPHPDLHRQGADRQGHQGRPFNDGTPGERWSTRARTTRTACTRRTGGSSARSASTTTTTRSRRPTTSSWSGRS